MNTNVKTKINRLGLVGVIIAIVLVVSTVINFALATNATVRRFGLDSEDAYGTLERKVLTALAEHEDLAVREETEESVICFLTLEDGETISFTKNNGEYEVSVPTSENTNYLFYTDDPLGDLSRLNAIRFFSSATAIAQVVSAAFSVVVFVFLLLAADAFRRCDSPFEDRVIRRMNVFAWVLLANALFNLLLSLATEIGTRVFYQNISGYYTNNGILESVLYLVTPSFPLVVSLIVLFLVRVFRHGAELQKESDETL